MTPTIIFNSIIYMSLNKRMSTLTGSNVNVCTSHASMSQSQYVYQIYQSVPIVLSGDWYLSGVGKMISMTNEYSSVLVVSLFTFFLSLSISLYAKTTSCSVYPNTLMSRQFAFSMGECSTGSAQGNTTNASKNRFQACVDNIRLFHSCHKTLFST